MKFYDAVNNADTPPQAVTAFMRGIGKRSCAMADSGDLGHVPWIHRKMDEFERLMSACQSPIEKMLGAGLLVIWPGPVEVFLFEAPSPTSIVITPQAVIGDYRIDFLLHAHDASAQTKLGLIVECDGHDYHERTKQQAQSDKSRDRALVSAGYRVVRFTGSEIFRAPWDCAEEVDRLVETLYWNQAEDG